MTRLLPIALLLCMTARLAEARQAAEAPNTLASLIGSASLPGDAIDHSGLEGDVMPGVPHARLGSLGSGLDLIDAFPGGVHLLAISDRGPADGAAPFHCRFHRLTLRVDTAATPPVSVTCDATRMLKRPDGEPFIGLASELDTIAVADGSRIARRLDPEAIRHLPSGDLLIADEYGPCIHEFDAHGAFVRTWPVPESFRCMHVGKDEAAELPPSNSTGRQPNKGFEGLAVTPAGAVWALPQAPLLQDTQPNAKGKPAGRLLRMLRLGSIDGSVAPRQVVYRLESQAYGTCELLALDETRFLVIERDGAASKFRRVYLIDTADATDVSARDTLPADEVPDGVRPVTKRLLVDLIDATRGVTIMPEKIEGLCFGPTLADGRRTLVVASDNDMKTEQPTMFWVFALPEWATPQAAKMSSVPNASVQR